METKFVKVYVSEEIHVVLSQIQEDLKEKLKKKVALAEILLEFAKKGMENFSKANFNIEKEEEIETTAITIHVLGKTLKILIKIQGELKEKLQKKVALAEILLKFAKKGMENDFAQNEIAKNDEKDRFTQNEIAKNDEKDEFTQNYRTFTQNLIAKHLQNTQNEQYLDERYNNFEQKEEKLKELEYDLKQFEKELKEEREDLYEQRWNLVRLQEEVTSKLLDSRDKNLMIKQLENEMLRFSNNYIEKYKEQSDEIYRLEQKNDRDAEKYERRITKLESEKQKLLYRLDRFENTLKDLNFSSKTLINNVEHFISKSNEKTFLDYIETLLPAILTFGVLNKDKIIAKFNSIKKEFSKQKSEKDKSV